MKKILAVSGGVDSMAMLDLIMRRFPDDEIVVATFDHGTRESSSLDVEFVCDRLREFVKVGRGRFKVYKGQAELGSGASEEKARKERYAFLHQIAELEEGEIYTAHHLDDLVESVAINFWRGTGVRGLAVLNAPDVRRPFLDGSLGEIFDKRKILEYAAKNEIVFRQDPTNTDENYLRNRLRPKVLAMTWGQKKRIFNLWQEQKQLLSEIDEIVQKLIPENLDFEREWFYEMDDGAALEILRAAIGRAGISATRPQILDFLKAIREYKPGKKFNLPEDNFIEIGRHSFKFKA